MGNPQNPSDNPAPVGSPPQLPPDTPASPETANDLRRAPESPPPPPPRNVSADRAHPGRPPLRPHHRGGGGRRPRGLPSVKRPAVGRSRPMIVGRGTGLRFCCQDRGMIDGEACQSCEEYCHWPEGTSDEPRECWHDWRLRQSIDESDEDAG